MFVVGNTNFMAGNMFVVVCVMTLAGRTLMTSSAEFLAARTSLLCTTMTLVVGWLVGSIARRCCTSLYIVVQCFNINKIR